MAKKFFPLYYGGKKMEMAKGIRVGNLVFLSGMNGWSPESGNVYDKTIPIATTDALEQTEIMMNKVKQSLEEMGSSMANIIKHTVYIKQGEDTTKILRAVKDFYYKYAPILREQPPAGTCIVVNGLYREDEKVEIDITAEVLE